MNKSMELTVRRQNATKLVEDFNLNKDREFFSDPENRLEFIVQLTSQDFEDLLRHINARMRGFEPRNKDNQQDKGGYLPMLGTPSEAEKPEALMAGFDTIKTYLAESCDSPEEKIRGVAMAIEALIIWVHPFNDGNGRTSRFIASFIQNGTIDMDQLIAETTSHRARPNYYDERLRVDEYNTCQGVDLVLTDEEEAELEKTKMPVAEGISLSLESLLKNKRIQERIKTKAESYRKYMEERALRKK